MNITRRCRLLSVRRVMCPVLLRISQKFVLGCMVAFLAACGNRTPATDRVIDWSSVADDPSRTLEIRWMGPLGFDKALPGGWMQSRVEELFNVKLEPMFVDPVTFNKVLVLRFVAGDIPDVFWDGDPLRVRAKVKQGFVLELPYEVIVEHAPNYVAYVNAQAPEAWMYSYSQGKNWGIPTVVPAGKIPLISIWRADWLEKVGIAGVPRTLDEYHEAFRRFTFDDPDGNGLKDTYGLSPSVAHWSYSFSEFFAQRKVLPFDLQEVDGEITWGGIRPEAKEVLSTLRNWYTEGIINPDFVLGTASEPDAPLVQGRVGYFGLASATMLDPTQPRSLANSMANLGPDVRLVPGPPPLGADGSFHRRTWGGGGHVLQFSAEIEPEKVLRVLRMLDAIYSDPDLALDLTLGRRGLHWEYSSGQGVQTLEPYKDKRAEAEMISPGNLYGPGFFAPSGLPLEAIAPLRADWQREMVRDASRPEWGLINAFGKTDVLASATQTLGDLRQMQEAYYVDIIRGMRPIEDFDVFVSEWRKKGGDRLLEEAAEFRTKRDEVWKIVGATAGEGQ